MLRELLEPMAFYKGLIFEVKIDDSVNGYSSFDVIRLEVILINLIIKAL